jgi:hypothetical protein
MSGTLAHLQPNEEAAVSQYVNQLIHHLNGRLVEVHRGKRCSGMGCH